MNSAGSVKTHSHSDRARVLLSAENISAGYGTKPVLQDASIKLAEGELVGLVGPNGSGKSTMLHCMTGYHPLLAGHVTVLNKPVTLLNRRAVAERIAFVPQHTESVYSFSVLEMVLMGRHLFAGLSAVDSLADVDIALRELARLEITHLAGRSFGKLSGGEKQLVILARAFAQNAPVLVLDEPLTGLDLRHQYQLMKALSGAADERRAILATFHDLSFAARWCNRLALLKSGRVMACGTPADVITSQNITTLYGVEAQVGRDSAGYLSIHVTGCSPSGK